MILSGLILVMLVVWIPVPFVLRRWDERTLERRCSEMRGIALTFDDGPLHNCTPEVLDVLRDEGVKASFFVIGERAKIAPEIIARMVQEGHEVGNHTETHLHAWKSLPWRNLKDITQGANRLLSMGVKTNAFRPPWGKMTMAGLVLATLKGYRLEWWTVDTQDVWAPRDIEDILAEIDRKGGGVVLMHDTLKGHSQPKGVGRTVDDLVAQTRAIINFAKKHDYRLVRVSELHEPSIRKVQHV